MVGQILQCPKEVSSTGYVRITADATKCPASKLQPVSYQWDYKATEYDPIKQVRVGSALGFNLTKEEVEKWSKS